jgi:dTDP-4-amino-4,6-dideoxygalactose transaminase
VKADLMGHTQFSPWPSFSEEEADRVREVLLSNRVNYWTGTEGRAFEKEYAAFAGTKYAVALANGTVALDLSLKVLDIGPGDEVVVTPRSFIASVSSVVNAGASPVFADVDRTSGNLSAGTIEKVITDRTRAILCVHLAGWPCEMDGILELASQHDLHIIEDCAQAHGARYKGQSVGSIGHVSAWSFCQDKIMTTGGEGGMVTTSDEELWSAMWSYKDHGKNLEAVENREHPPGFRWLHDSFGTNWRLTEMQSTIGRIQLSRMPGWHEERIANARAIWECARNIRGLRAPEVPGYMEHAAYKCYVYVEPDQLESGWSRDRIMQEISRAGVPCFSGACPEIYLEKAFDNTGWRPEKRLPVARELGETSLMFLVHPTLKTKEISLTCNALADVMKLAVR